jgi:uncharacterized protein (UPF0147 family)
MPLIEPKHIEKIVQNILSTEADYEIYRNIEKLTEKALYELEKIEKKNEAIIALQSLTILQPQTFKQLFNQ